MHFEGLPGEMKIQLEGCGYIVMLYAYPKRSFAFLLPSNQYKYDNCFHPLHSYSHVCQDQYLRMGTSLIELGKYFRSNSNGLFGILEHLFKIRKVK